MSIFNFKTAALAIVAGVGLSGCAYGPYGGLGVGVGYGNGYGYDYGDRYYSGYSPYGYGYGSPYGWYDGYYYPGSGYYVYDRYRRPIRWNDTQQRYWQWRQRGAPRSTSPTGQILQNWADFQNGPQATNVVRQRDLTSGRTFRTQPTVVEQRSQTVQQQERRAARAEAREERSAGRGERRRANRD